MFPLISADDSALVHSRAQFTHHTGFMSHTSTTAVVIGYVWPEPDSSAAGQNMYALLTMLVSSGWQVTFMTAAADSVHSADLSVLGVSVCPVALNCASFDQQLAEMNPSLVIFDRYMTEEQFSWRVKQTCPDAIRILNTEDLHFLRHARHEAVRKNQPADDADLNTTLMQRELASILRSDVTLLVSQAELALLTDKFGVPKKQLRFHPLPVPCSHGPTEDFDQRRDFVFIGNYRHAPNWDAVLQLRQIWPAIRSKIGRVNLHLYGAYPPKKATQLHNPDAGFLVEGWAEDATRVIREARVMLAPIRFGAGIKGKLMTAMACETPSVTTSIGAEGLNRACWPGVIADDQADFISAAAMLYTDKAQWQGARNNAAYCLDDYQKAGEAQSLLRLFDTLIRSPQAHRAQNYLQSMLWHHTLKSTQYMSQWIEQKNRLKDA